MPWRSPRSSSSDRFAPAGYKHLREFRRDIGARFSFELGPVDLSKAVYLARDSDTVVVEYTFDKVREPVDLILRPLVGLRDFHMLQRSDAPLSQQPLTTGSPFARFAAGLASCGWAVPTCGSRAIRNGGSTSSTASIGVADLHHIEDLWAPGFFKGQIRGPGRIIFWGRLGDPMDLAGMSPVDVDAIKQDLLRRQEELVRLAAARDEATKVLCLAADQFVVKRRSVEAERTTIVAGFPWFADWGRDTFISLPGLLLSTGRHDEAGSVLRTFAAAADGGMIPNRFDDRSGEAHFNSVDASLWFIHAAFEYLDVTGDVATVARDLLPVMRWIIDSYQGGTYFGIHADVDGLIMAGDAGTQLTWMDAMCDGTAFTPRYGKAVEINALWHNALRRMQGFCEGQALPGADRYAAMAEQVGRSFSSVFWNPQRGYLNDTVQPDGAIDASLRPNQVFAVSLPFAPPLTREQREAVVVVVERELLTPYGLRTLSRRDPFYKGRYAGSARCRDEAYHQGTVWPYLIGPFIEACLRLSGFSPPSRQRAADLIRPLLRHLTEDACLGSISEVLDGDPPHNPGGCPAQAWSVAELLRVYRMISA